jgi:hypothetical protein
VTHNGTPVGGVKATFHSPSEMDGKQDMAYGPIADSFGNYLIAASDKNPGTPAGVYKVTITK